MRSSSAFVLPFVVIAASACTPPPPAPEGLDGASSYLVEEFWADDPTFQAGIQGFMNWFDDEGKDLVGEQATIENSDTFSVSALSEANVQHLPLDAEIVNDIEGDEEIRGPRVIGNAAGVVSLAQMDCGIEETLQYLIRPDQDEVFAGDWEGYERTYVPDADARAVHEQAMADRTFTPIRERIDPFAADFDPSEYLDTLLFTDNIADPTQVLVANLPGYDLNLDFRQGVYELSDGTEAAAFAIITYNPAAVWGPAGNNALVQSYSIELNIERDGGTLRMLAVWAEPKGSGIEPDSALARNYAVNKSLKSSNRVSAICAGEIDIGTN